MFRFLLILFSLLSFNSIAQNNINNPSVKYESKNFPSSSTIIVNNKIILKSEVDERLDFFIKTAKLKIFKQNNSNSLRHLIVERMIEEELIRQKASFYKITIDENQTEEYMQNFIEQNFAQKFKDLSSFKNYLAKNNWQFSNFYKQIETELIWQRVVESVIKPTINVSHIEVREWLEKEKIEGENYKYLLQDFIIGGADKDSQIIDQIYQEFKNNRNYRKFVANLLLGSNAEINNASWFWSSELNKLILPKINNLKNNDFSEPILLNDGWHIFKIYDKKIDLNISEKEYDFIKNQILNRKIEVAIKNYLQDLRKRAYIEIKP